MGDINLTTTYGPVRGRRLDGVVEFLGVRYGAPPVGEQRFMPPQAPRPWVDPVDALHFGPCAPQAPPGGIVDPGGKVPPGIQLLGEIHALKGSEPESEDCLFLNVWTPGVEPSGRRPVMVWLHGGGFTAGSGASPVWQGANLARAGDVVLVTVNHRLGALGYLSQTAAGSSTDNPGVLDLVLALEWVRDNIERFGGDPGCVTIFGQSGGGWKVSAMLGTPSADELYHRAMIQSGPGMRMGTREAAEDLGERFLWALQERSGITDVRVADARQITDAQLAAEMSLGRTLDPNAMRGFAPFVDGTVLPAHPFDPVARPAVGSVPLIVGHTQTEMTIYFNEDELRITGDELEARAAQFGPRAVQALPEYRELYPKADAGRLLAYLHCESVMLPNTLRILERHAALGSAPGYYYRVDFETPVADGLLHSPHALELPFVFRTLEGTASYTGGGQRAARMADIMSSVWTAFAATGDPNPAGRGLPTWPRFAPAAPEVLVFDETCRVEAAPSGRHRQIAEEINAGMADAQAAEAQRA